MTISTVGYGDIGPSPNAGMRIFTVLYILVGSGYAFGQLANLLDGVLEAFTIRVKRLLKRTSGRDRTAATGDGTVGAEVLDAGATAGAAAAHAMHPGSKGPGITGLPACTLTSPGYGRSEDIEGLSVRLPALFRVRTQS